MKRNWQPSELLKCFLLDDSDFELLKAKAGHTRLGFAVLLKFFQLEAHFPRAKTEVPMAVVSFLAQQLDLAPELFLQYNWQGHQIKRHRVEIRTALGFWPASKVDAQDLYDWLVEEEIFAQEYQLPLLKARCYQRLCAFKIEPMADKLLERVVRSAGKAYERALVERVHHKLNDAAKKQLDELLHLPSADRAAVESVETVNAPDRLEQLFWQDLKADPGGPKLESILKESAKLARLQKLVLPSDLFETISAKVVRQYRSRAGTEELHELKRHPAPLRHTLLAAFCQQRQSEITDSLIELLLSITHRIGTRAERRVSKQMLRELRRKNNKDKLLYQIAKAVVKTPDETVRQLLFPLIGEQIFKELAEEAELNEGQGDYYQQVHHSMRDSYSHHYRRMVPPTLAVLNFESDSTQPQLQGLLKAVDLIRRSTQIEGSYFETTEKVPLEWLTERERSGIVVLNEAGQSVVDRLNYEIAVLEALRDKVRHRQVWVMGARRYRNPAQDLPTQAQWQAKKDQYFEELKLPQQAETFVQNLKTQMEKGLDNLNAGLPTNPKVKVLSTGSGWINLSPLEAQNEPPTLQKLKAQLALRWPMTSLLDVLKETALRTGFLEDFHTATVREQLEEPVLHKRLLLSMYALGTNIGLKRVSAGDHGQSYRDLVYVRHRYMLRDHLRQAIGRVTKATFEARLSSIWGEATAACASDSTKFGAVDQNLMTQWHNRYGGAGVMAYWHVERKAVCIYSQLKSCSSSEVAAMLEGILRHLSEVEVQKNYTDTHGQSEIGFAFSQLLGFELLPRLKNIGSQKLYKPYSIVLGKWANLNPILTRPIDWKLIAQQYEEMVKYATALKQGLSEAETMLRQFTREGVQHPTYQALAELGRAVKTIFLCRYLQEESLRREIQQGLNVIETWNGVNDFIFYGRGGEFTSNRLEDQEVSLLALHLLQSSLVYINTLLLQRVLSEKEWLERLQAEDYRGLSPLVHLHINPYGNFRLNLEERMPIEKGGASSASGEVEVG